MTDRSSDGCPDCGHPEVQHEEAIRAGINWFTQAAFDELPPGTEGEVWWFCGHCVDGCHVLGPVVVARPASTGDTPLSGGGRMKAAADFLANHADYQPDEVDLLSIVHQAMIDLVNREVRFGLVADNIDRPNAEKYGTHPDGSPRYAPEWYAVMGVKTGIHESLYGTLRKLLSCEHRDEHGHECIGSLLHVTVHHDGNGNNWWDDGVVL